MERFQRWHPGCPPHPAGGADHGTHSDLPNDGGRGHYLGSLIQMSLHWFVGHRPLGGAIHRIHMLEHHGIRSEEHTSELQSRLHLVCRLLLEKKKKTAAPPNHTTYSSLT